jgi:hypothetical protein
LRRCRRYWYKSPLLVNGGGGGETATHLDYLEVPFPVPMRAGGALTYHDDQATAGNVVYQNISGGIVSRGVGFSSAIRTDSGGDVTGAVVTANAAPASAVWHNFGTSAKYDARL